MEPFVLDASLTLSWCFSDEATSYLRWRNAQRITKEGIAAFLDTLQRLPIQIERREALWLWQTVLPLARKHGLSAYDAAYLELAKREKMQLATLDRDLQEAGHALGIPLVEVS